MQSNFVDITNTAATKSPTFTVETIQIQTVKYQLMFTCSANSRTRSMSYTLPAFAQLDSSAESLTFCSPSSEHWSHCPTLPTTSNVCISWTTATVTTTSMLLLPLPVSTVSVQSTGWKDSRLTY